MSAVLAGKVCSQIGVLLIQIFIRKFVTTRVMLMPDSLYANNVLQNCVYIWMFYFLKYGCSCITAWCYKTNAIHIPSNKVHEYNSIENNLKEIFKDIFDVK